MGQPPLTILVIDDSPEDRALLRRLLTQGEPGRYELLDAGSGETGLSLWRERRPDCVLVDYLLPDMSGLDLLAAAPEHSDGGAPVIMLAGAADAAVAVEALERGAQDYLAKDQLTADSLRRAIAYTLEKVRLRREQQQTLAALRASEERLRLALDAGKQAEERLRLFEQVVMNMNDALLVTEAEPIDEPGPRIVYANPAFTRMSGYTLEEIVGKSPRILQGPGSSRDELDRLRTALERWRSTRIELVNYRKDGSAFDVEFDVVPIADSTGWYTHWISVQREVTERKRAEAERVQLLAEAQQARDMAEEAVRVRDQFLSIAAHELKNPLTVLLGNAQLLERRAARTGELPEREQRMLGAIREQADRLNELITSLFDVSRIEMGQLLLTRAPLDLGPLVRRIVTELQPTLTRHTLSFSGPSEPLILEGDALRLEQVVQNLVGNALKYSPAGGPVTVQVERRAGQGCITVTDHGIGIPETALPYLFRRFFRADNTRRQQIPGTGVGLYVVKEIVTRHGGEVLVSSTEGAGSSFTVCLPLQGAG